MNKTTKDIVFDAIFLIALAFAVSGLIINILISGDAAEAAHEPTTTTATIAEETVEPTQEPTETTPPVILYDVPLEEALQLHIIEQAETNGIDPAIILAMSFRESTYRTDAIGDGGKSYGLLQIQPKWHYQRMQKLGCTDLLDPFQNVTVAIDYLCELLNRYNGNIAKALTAYNKGHCGGTITQYARDVMAKAEELGASAK